MLPFMPNRATKRQFDAELARHPGATLDTSEVLDFEFIVDAPRGSVWRSCGIHCMCEPHKNESGQSWKPEAYAALIERMRDGLEPCIDPDCDICCDQQG